LRSPAPAGACPARCHARQHPFGGFEFGELIRELLPFRIDPRQPLGEALPFRGYVVSYSHVCSLFIVRGTDLLVHIVRSTAVPG
jgi:hypothetical protein